MNNNTDALYELWNLASATLQVKGTSNHLIDFEQEEGKSRDSSQRIKITEIDRNLQGVRWDVNQNGISGKGHHAP